MFGMRIFENDKLLVATGEEDWSRVRSPGRARRRRHKHRQNIVQVMKPDPNFYVDKARNAVYCHPAMAQALREATVAEPPRQRPVWNATGLSTPLWGGGIINKNMMS